MESQHVDVLIVGAGLSGICAAYYLQKECPDKTFTLLEGRDAIGGTWDLFRYPGVRSDSDMHTFGFSFYPWTGAKLLADGDAIRTYIREASIAFNIDRYIRFKHRVTRISWSSDESLWTVTAEVGAEQTPTQFTCNFLHVCSGYYRYDEGYTPTWNGTDRFQGEIIHPQKWREDLNYRGKRVVIIGSGATAVTLVPAMAQDAEHVIMLQRSPTYVISRPSESGIANYLHNTLPASIAYRITRWLAILLQIVFFQVARRAPKATKQNLITQVQEHLGEDYDVEKHFTPTYNPWEQRLCLVPDADLFEAIKSGNASVVTDHIDHFTEKGICLQSGELLEADIIVTATGLNMQIMAGVQICVDGEDIAPGDTLSYRGMMLSNVPNLALTFGYTNASWTLRAELISEYVCRLLTHMDAHGYTECRPTLADMTQLAVEPPLDFSSGYVQRAMAHLPKQSTAKPWKVYQNYLIDIAYLRYSTLDDGVMQFSRKT